MRKSVYVLTIGISVVYDDKEVDYQLDNYYFDTLDEAFAEADNYIIGDIDGEYADGALCIIDSVYVDDEPKEFEFF